MEPIVLISNFTTQNGISKKLKPLQKGQHPIIDKPTDVTYTLIDLNKKETVHVTSVDQWIYQLFYMVLFGVVVVFFRNSFLCCKIWNKNTGSNF